ncbi:hypothetical protein PR048_003252 [Dryococelus australis]|uniref:Uncharacterized protein n=1 Tax=Dryococelus australis TaxID=614101 RepID=A0ABQ9IP07_9NEOP|nr:hypothetical protein PR048_003252 [Dryococelus australis]
MKPGCKQNELCILNVKHLLAASWNSIESTTITNCFKKAGFIENETPSPSVVPTDSEDPSAIPRSACKTRVNQVYHVVLKAMQVSMMCKHVLNRT